MFCGFSGQWLRLGKGSELTRVSEFTTQQKEYRVCLPSSLVGLEIFS